jgi:hypothetical protein
MWKLVYEGINTCSLYSFQCEDKSLSSYNAAIIDSDMKNDYINNKVTVTSHIKK